MKTFRNAIHLARFFHAAVGVLREIDAILCTQNPFTANMCILHLYISRKGTAIFQCEIAKLRVAALITECSIRGSHIPTTLFYIIIKGQPRQSHL
jgi:hypothetical protein